MLTKTLQHKNFLLLTSNGSTDILQEFSSSLYDQKQY